MIFYLDASILVTTMQNSIQSEHFRNTIKQIVIFLVVGAITLLIDVTVTRTLYSAFHFPAYLASGIGFLSGFVFNFPMNRKKVFHHSSNDTFSLRVQIFLYAGLSMFNLIATSLAVGLLTDNKVVAIQYAKIIVTAIFAIWNFIVFKFFIFSKRNSAQSLAEQS